MVSALWTTLCMMTTIHSPPSPLPACLKTSAPNAHRISWSSYAFILLQHPLLDEYTQVTYIEARSNVSRSFKMWATCGPQISYFSINITHLVISLWLQCGFQPMQVHTSSLTYSKCYSLKTSFTSLATEQKEGRCDHTIRIFHGPKLHLCWSEGSKSVEWCYLIQYAKNNVPKKIIRPLTKATQSMIITIQIGCWALSPLEIFWRFSADLYPSSSAS